MDSKTCTKCGEEKPVTEFYAHHNAKDGLRSMCKVCHNQERREHHRLNPFKSAFTAARKRAEKAKVPFDITERYLEVIFPRTCPVFGTPLHYPRSRGVEEMNNINTPNLDRIVPHLGYTQDNVVWISSLANRIKSDATHEQIRQVADWLEATMKEKEAA